MHFTISFGSSFVHLQFQMFFKRREQQRNNRARRAKGKVHQEESQESNNPSTNKSQAHNINNSQADNFNINNSLDVVANPAEGKLPKTDFSNILNSTAIEGGNGLELFPQTKIAPITNSALDPKQNLEKMRVEKTPDIEFLEAREVECPDCEKKFTARAKLLGHLVSHHYSEEIYKLFPFNKGGLCPLCIDSGE